MDNLGADMNFSHSDMAQLNFSAEADSSSVHPAAGLLAGLHVTGSTITLPIQGGPVLSAHGSLNLPVEYPSNIVVAGLPPMGLESELHGPLPHHALTAGGANQQLSMFRGADGVTVSNLMGLTAGMQVLPPITSITTASMLPMLNPVSENAHMHAPSNFTHTMTPLPQFVSQPPQQAPTHLLAHVSNVPVPRNVKSSATTGGVYTTGGLYTTSGVNCMPPPAPMPAPTLAPFNSTPVPGGIAVSNMLQAGLGNIPPALLNQLVGLTPARVIPQQLPYPGILEANASTMQSASASPMLSGLGSRFPSSIGDPAGTLSVNYNQPPTSAKTEMFYHKATGKNILLPPDLSAGGPNLVNASAGSAPGYSNPGDQPMSDKMEQHLGMDPLSPPDSTTINVSDFLNIPIRMHPRDVIATGSGSTEPKATVSAAAAAAVSTCLGEPQVSSTSEDSCGPIVAGSGQTLYLQKLAAPTINVQRQPTPNAVQHHPKSFSNEASPLDVSSSTHEALMGKFESQRQQMAPPSGERLASNGTPSGRGRELPPVEYEPISDDEGEPKPAKPMQQQQLQQLQQQQQQQQQVRSVAAMSQSATFPQPVFDPTVKTNNVSALYNRLNSQEHEERSMALSNQVGPLAGGMTTVSSANLCLPQLNQGSSTAAAMPNGLSNRMVPPGSSFPPLVNISNQDIATELNGHGTGSGVYVMEAASTLETSVHSSLQQQQQHRTIQHQPAAHHASPKTPLTSSDPNGDAVPVPAISDANVPDAEQEALSCKYLQVPQDHDDDEDSWDRDSDDPDPEDGEGCDQMLGGHLDTLAEDDVGITQGDGQAPSGRQTARSRRAGGGEGRTPSAGAGDAFSGVKLEGVASDSDAARPEPGVGAARQRKGRGRGRGAGRGRRKGSSSGFRTTISQRCSQILSSTPKGTFVNQVDVSVHVEETQRVVVDGQTRWSCLVCPKTYSSKHNLVTHILGHSGIKPHCCSICGKFFKQASHLQQHMLVHGNIKPHACPICSRTFTQASHVKRHMAVHMERRPHMCEVCGRGFVYPSELKGHMEKHINGRENACEICNENFDTAKKLKHHRAQVHRSVSDLTCKDCGKVFTYPSQLRDHMMKHGGKRPYICGECGMDFLKEHHLKAHQFTHTGLRPFACHLCNRSFNQKANMQRHLAIHQNARTYQCEVCDRSFTQPQVLKAHMVTHSDSKPFQCKLCGKQFSRQHNLNGHMTMHEGEKPHVCFCGAAFTLKGNLNRHRRIKHGIREGAEYTEEEAAKILNEMSSKKVYESDTQDSVTDTGTGTGTGTSEATPLPKKKRKSAPPRKTIEQVAEDTEVEQIWKAGKEEGEDGDSETEDEDEEDEEVAVGDAEVLDVSVEVSQKKTCEADTESGPTVAPPPSGGVTYATPVRNNSVMPSSALEPSGGSRQHSTRRRRQVKYTEVDSSEATDDDTDAAVLAPPTPADSVETSSGRRVKRNVVFAGFDAECPAGDLGTGIDDTDNDPDWDSGKTGAKRRRSVRGAVGPGNGQPVTTVTTQLQTMGSNL